MSNADGEKSSSALFFFMIFFFLIIKELASFFNADENADEKR